MNNRPRFSVVIPCSNGANFIRATIESVLTQSYPAYEVIVIDDGSADTSGEIAAGYGESIRVIRQDNAGESVARNRGISLAQGDWIALLDADDIFEPSKLEAQADAIAKHGDIVCVYTDSYLFSNDQRLEDIPQHEDHAEPDYKVRMLSDWSVHPSSVAIRADVAKATPFPEDIRDSEDMIFMLMLRMKGRFVRIPQALSGYRRSSTQQTAQPGHVVRSVEARFQWLTANQHLFSAGEREAMIESLCNVLKAMCNKLLWTNADAAVASKCMSLYRSMRPQTKRIPTELSPWIVTRFAGKVQRRTSRFVNSLSARLSS